MKTITRFSLVRLQSVLQVFWNLGLISLGTASGTSLIGEIVRQNPGLAEMPGCDPAEPRARINSSKAKWARETSGVSGENIRLSKGIFTAWKSRFYKT